MFAIFGITFYSLVKPWVGNKLLACAAIFWLFLAAGLFHLLHLMSVPLWSIRWNKITENLVNQIWDTDFIQNIEFLTITKLWDETCQTATSNICCWKLEIPMIQTGRLYYYKVKPKTCHLCPFIVGIITGSFCLLHRQKKICWVILTMKLSTNAYWATLSNLLYTVVC